METTLRAQARARAQAQAQEQAQENVNEHTYEREYAHERTEDGHPATRPQAYPIRGKVHRMKSALNGSAMNVHGRARGHVRGPVPGMKSERHFPCHNENDKKYAPSYNLEDRQMQEDPYENGLSLWNRSGRGYGGGSNRSGYQYGIEVVHSKSYSRDGDDESAYPPPPFDPIFINDPLVPMRRPATAMPSAAQFDSMGAREHPAADADIDARKNRPATGRSTRAKAERMEYNDNDELWDRGYAQQQQESLSQRPEEGGPIIDDNYDPEVADRARRWREIRKQTDALVFGTGKDVDAVATTEQRPKPRSQCLVYVAMTEEEKIALRNAEKIESERKLEVLGQKEEICAVCTLSVSSQPSDVSSVFVEDQEDIQGTPFNPHFQSIRTIKQRGGQVRTERDVRLLSFRNRCTCVCSCQQGEEVDVEGDVSNNEDGDISISSEEKEPGRFASTQHDPMTRSKIRGILLSPSAPVVKNQQSFVRRAKIDDKASSKKKTIEDRKSSPMRQRISNMRNGTPSTSTARSRKAYENRRKLSTHSPPVRKMRNASPRRQRLTERHVIDLHLHAASKGEEPTDDDENKSISPDSISGESEDLPAHGIKIAEVEVDISLPVSANGIKDDNIQQNKNPGKKNMTGQEITSNSIKDDNIELSKKSGKKKTADREISPSRQHVSETRYGLSPLAPIVQIQNRDEEQQKQKASNNERKERFVTQRRQKISELKREMSPTKPANSDVPVVEILKSQLPHERRNQPKFLDNDILNGERAEKFMARRRKITSKMKGGSPTTEERDFSPPPLDVDEKDSFARRKVRRQKRQEQTAGRANDDDRD